MSLGELPLNKVEKRTEFCPDTIRSYKDFLLRNSSMFGEKDVRAHLRSGTEESNVQMV